jgi:twinkle protein
MADATKGAAFLDAHRKELPGIATPKSVRDELRMVYRDGLGKGDRSGWPSVDKLFSVAQGQVTTITGWPNSGKSQWLDALALNLARQGWRFVFCSLENIPVFLHVEKLAKQFIGKPMRPGPTERMSEDEIDEATIEMNEWFSFVVPSERKPNPSLADVLVVIEDDFKRRGLWEAKEAKLSCVIDPWNELEHVRPHGLSLTEYVGECLSMLRQWARRHMLHVFIVGHPAKQPRNRATGKLPVPTPDMISDSAHFWNKSDNCIAVALVDEHRSKEVDVHVQKIRFAHIGRRGQATLHFDVATGRYHEPPSKFRAVGE